MMGGRCLKWSRVVAIAGLAAGLCLTTTACKRDAASRAKPVGASPAHPPAQPPPLPKTATSATAGQKSRLPPDLEVGDLDKDELALLADILGDQFDPCGKSRSFLESLRAGDCALGSRLARFLVRGLQDGHGRRRLVTMLLREIERLNTVVQVNIEGAIRLGDPKAKVKVVVFSDFECPFCQRAAQPAQRLQAHYGVVLYYRHFPLTSHPLAEGAARAAWAADRQGKFWPMHDLLFANQADLKWPAVKALAARLGLDQARFQKDVESEAARAAVRRDYDHGVDAGVDGTPTFFVNGRRAETVEQLQDSIREQLALAGAQNLPSPLDLAEAVTPASDAPTGRKEP